MQYANALKTEAIPVSIEFVKSLFGSSLPDSPLFSMPSAQSSDTLPPLKRTSLPVKA